MSFFYFAVSALLSVLGVHTRMGDRSRTAQRNRKERKIISSIFSWHHDLSGISLASVAFIRFIKRIK